MAQIERREMVVNNVPDTDVERVMQDFWSEGASVRKERQQDGNWKIIALFIPGREREVSRS